MGCSCPVATLWWSIAKPCVTKVLMWITQRVFFVSALRLFFCSFLINFFRSVCSGPLRTPHEFLNFCPPVFFLLLHVFQYSAPSLWHSGLKVVPLFAEISLGNDELLINVDVWTERWLTVRLNGLNVSTCSALFSAVVQWSQMGTLCLLRLPFKAHFVFPEAIFDLEKLVLCVCCYLSNSVTKRFIHCICMKHNLSLVFVQHTNPAVIFFPLPTFSLFS